MSHGWKESAY